MSGPTSRLLSLLSLLQTSRTWPGGELAERLHVTRRTVRRDVERLRERHEQGVLLSIDYLKELAELAKEAVAAEREVVPEEEQDLGKAALTELFEGTKNENTPIIVERVVSDIDDIVEKVRFPEWQHTDEGERTVKGAR